jgi:hypothetical protein
MTPVRLNSRTTKESFAEFALPYDQVLSLHFRPHPRADIALATKVARACQQGEIDLTAKRTVEIWESQPVSTKKAALPALGTTAIRVSQVDVEVVSDNLASVLATFQQMLEKQPRSASGYYVDEIEISFGVSGSGGIALIGKVEAGVEASIKVKLKRSTQP